MLAGDEDQPLRAKNEDAALTSALDALAGGDDDKRSALPEVEDEPLRAKTLPSPLPSTSAYAQHLALRRPPKLHPQSSQHSAPAISKPQVALDASAQHPASRRPEAADAPTKNKTVAGGLRGQWAVSLVVASEAPEAAAAPTKNKPAAGGLAGHGRVKVDVGLVPSFHRPSGLIHQSWQSTSARTILPQVLWSRPARPEAGSTSAAHTILPQVFLVPSSTRVEPAGSPGPESLTVDANRQLPVQPQPSSWRSRPVAS